jgi:hypothetical protein
MDRYRTSVWRRAPGAALKACTLALCVGLGALIPAGASAQDTEERTTGLPAPSGLEWKFNFDATWGNFGFMNSLYANPKPDDPVPPGLGDNWFEGALKPALTATYTTSNSWQIWGKVSAVGERTYGAAPTLVGEDASSFAPEDLAIGLKSGKALKLGDDALEFTVGRAPFQLGHGFLLWDGAAEGGTRGGYWTNARKAFAFASIGRLHTGPHKVEAFYLDKDELPESNSDTRLFGTNYEASLGEATTLGATYMRFWANDLRPARNGMDVYNVRAYTAPLPNLQALSFEFEYANESNGDLIGSNAWNFQGAYELSEVAWTPKLSYRYAFFEGDNPETAKNEAWDPLLLGFYDWGTWWQGEIAGEYFISNSNVASHQVRLHLAPTPKLGTGVILWDFLADHPEALGATAKDVAFELDWYADWKLNSNVTMSVIAAFASPGKFVQQLYDRTQNFGYGMLFFAYSY